MKAIVAGGRWFTPKTPHYKWLKAQLRRLNATVIVCGMARGADRFGRSVAQDVGLQIEEHPADWALYGRRAGHVRNYEMVKSSDACILFPGGKGTESMRKIAHAQGLIVIEWKEERDQNPSR